MIFTDFDFLNFKPYHLHGYTQKIIQIIIICSGLLHSTISYSNGDDYKLKAAYIYQFTKFTEWPGSFFANEGTPISICVLGRNPFGKSLDGFSRRASQDRKLSIQYLTSLTNISNCHVVFISKSEEKRLPQILQRIESSPVLSVSDMDGFARRGGIIGFVPKKRRVGLEINVNASRTAGARISSKLLEVATLVQGELQVKNP